MSRIALIHALEDSIAPIRAAFDRHWPEATCMDLLDTSLSADLIAAGALDGAMVQRFRDLGRYAAGLSGQGGQTKAILFTCSAFGAAIDAVKADQTIPVLRPNEAAFARALKLGRRLALVVTFPPSLAALRAELESMATTAGQEIDVTPILAEGALAALKAGDGAGHDAKVLRACEGLGHVDALILGQFSLARASGPLAQSLDIPIVTTPDSAVLALKSQLAHP
ncbi:MAG: hypothetical protein COW54_10025 [Rhodobacteraceae bacterium CG17_big_fil_post_rev_8_21_14_2_50_63_15]|nr:MAG: hypothetical protein COW54_10025 [Rhodobacteraceae bacterium CG17_big_fil_post_rev_8_21_14_2_50_63_15]